ncbi:MAG: hypothetical protein ABI583_06940 [Betaproteobacteria bacterium]
MVAIIVLLFLWCKTDSSERGIVPPSGAPILCAFISPVGVPYYLFRSRPWRQASVGVVLALVLSAMMTAQYLAGFYLKTHVVT